MDLTDDIELKRLDTKKKVKKSYLNKISSFFSSIFSNSDQDEYQDDADDDNEFGDDASDNEFGYDDSDNEFGDDDSDDIHDDFADISGDMKFKSKDTKKKVQKSSLNKISSFFSSIFSNSDQDEYQDDPDADIEEREKTSLFNFKLFSFGNSEFFPYFVFAIIIIIIVVVFSILIYLVVDSNAKLITEKKKKEKIQSSISQPCPTQTTDPQPKQEQDQSSEITKEMIQDSLKETIDLNTTFNKLFDNAIVDVRSSYYEMQETDAVHRWTQTLWICYFIILSVLIIVIFMKANLSWWERFKLIFLIIFFTNMYVLKLSILVFVFIYQWIVNSVPKNIFLQLV